MRQLGRKAHDLIELYELLDPGYQKYLFNNDERSILSEQRNFFSATRYGYESGTPKSFNDSISKLAASTVCKVVYLYKLKGSNDPFILNFNVDEVYFQEVQKFLLYAEKP